MTGLDAVTDRLLRELAPQVLAVLVRRWGRFDACEDAVQEALLAAALQWPMDGIPANPKAWLVTVASRRLADEARSEQARERREERVAAMPGPGDDVERHDDTLTLLFLCCHPTISPSSQVALTLRAVGGLTTGQIARAFLVPEATMGQRISRAKQSIKGAGARFEPPAPEEWESRLAVVLHVLYLIFNEGYAASAGAGLLDVQLTAEAIRLTRRLHRLLPDDGEVAGLLALMLLTDARRLARTGPGGTLIPLADQDRSRWNKILISEGIALITDTLRSAPLGPYQVQAAIAAVHDEAPTAGQTDWEQILVLYEALQRLWPGPMVSLNHAVAVAMVDGPAAGLDLVTALEEDARLKGHHRVEAVRAHLLDMAGDRDGARVAYAKAARQTASLPERRYLEHKARQADPRMDW
ncbi:RNA polymerase sigma factor [Herbidospora sp. RD11066]